MDNQITDTKTNTGGQSESPDTACSNDRKALTPEELDAIMPEGAHVHTYLQSGPTLIGADWERSKILEIARKHGAELSGEEATAMKHGAVVWCDSGEPLFVATSS